jgi:hypothetical protein
MGMPSQREYEEREIRGARAQERAVENAPLADRKEAQLAFFNAMRDTPDLVAERIGWLLDGNYGYGAMIIAKDVLARTRMNREAALTQMIGIYEWQSPSEMTRAAWKRLTSGERTALGREVRLAIREAEESDESTTLAGAMKMRPEHFRALRTALLDAGGERLETIRAAYQARGLSAQRFRWDAFWAIPARIRDPLSKELYTYLNDSHIDTALKAIVEEAE